MSKYPDPAPDGFLRGVLPKNTNWLGKKFDALNNMGINVFLENGKKKNKYKFKTYKGKSFSDSNLDVLKIDYNVSSNPLYLRFLVDELVETKRGEYSGKLYFRIGGVKLGSFKLKK